MTITLSPAQESAVRQAIEKGVFGSIEEFIDSALKSLNQPSVEAGSEQKPFTNRHKKSFAQFLMESPLPGSGLNLEKLEDYPRVIDL